MFAGARIVVYPFNYSERTPNYRPDLSTIGIVPSGSFQHSILGCSDDLHEVIPLIGFAILLMRSGLVVRLPNSGADV